MSKSEDPVVRPPGPGRRVLVGDTVIVASWDSRGPGRKLEIKPAIVTEVQGDEPHPRLGLFIMGGWQPFLAGKIPYSEMLADNCWSFVEAQVAEPASA